MYKPLSTAMEVWHFDMRSPPQDSSHKSIDMEFQEDGRMNAVIFWFEMELFQGIKFSTSPQAISDGTLSPA